MLLALLLLLGQPLSHTTSMASLTAKTEGLLSPPRVYLYALSTSICSDLLRRHGWLRALWKGSVS